MAERVLLRIAKGCLEPADNHTARLLRERGYKIGDQVIADLRKPRNPKYHRLAHAFGQLCVDNLDDFHGLDGHTALKRLQTEADIECKHVPVRIDGQDVAEYRIPESLSFASLSQERFERVFQRMCAWVSETYWPSLTAEQISEMAECMVEAK